MSNYRVLVSYDPERSVFVARAPELEHCSAEGASRAEALTKVEEEITATLANMKEQGHDAPPALDLDGGVPGGEFPIKLSQTLARDLKWQAKLEGVDLNQLLGEMLAGGLDHRRQRTRRPQAASGNVQPPQPTGDDVGNTQQPPRRDGGRPQGNFRGGNNNRQDPRYHAIMDDRATFLEYVRGLESGQAPRAPRGSGGPGGGGGRNRPRGPQRPPGNGGGQGQP